MSRVELRPSYARRQSSAMGLASIGVSMPDQDAGRGRPEWWGQRFALCWDLPERIVEAAASDQIRDPGALVALDANKPAQHAVRELVNSADSSAVTPGLAHLLDDQVGDADDHGEAAVSDQEAYWIARERFASVEDGIPVEALLPHPRLQPQLPPPSRRPTARASARRRPSRRRVRGTARAPDDPSRLGHNREPAGRCRRSCPAPTRKQRTESGAAHLVAATCDSRSRPRRSV
jgi:hypothetical protein